MVVLQGCPYIDRNMYIESQPERYKGFLSSDFSKTDEFSLDIRTEQYRDQLRVCKANLGCSLLLSCGMLTLLCERRKGLWIVRRKV
jgi:hypothetical protein